MTNREKWSPVIDKAFADDIPLVDLLETIWQQAKKDYVPLIQEIHDKVAEEQYEKGYADAIDELSDLIDRLLWDYDLETYKDLSESFKKSARLLKEQNNDNNGID